MLLKQLNIQRYYGLFCDVVVRVGDVDFRAHRCVLAAASAKLQSLAFNIRQDWGGNMLVIDGISAEAFHVALEFIYSGCVRLDGMTTTVDEILAAAKYLGLPDVERACRELGARNTAPVKAESISVATERPMPKLTSIKDIHPASGASGCRLSADRVTSILTPSLAVLQDLTSYESSSGQEKPTAPPRTNYSQFSSFSSLMSFHGQATVDAVEEYFKIIESHQSTQVEELLRKSNDIDTSSHIAGINCAPILASFNPMGRGGAGSSNVMSNSDKKEINNYDHYVNNASSGIKFPELHLPNISRPFSSIENCPIQDASEMFDYSDSSDDTESFLAITGLDKNEIGFKEPEDVDSKCDIHVPPENCTTSTLFSKGPACHDGTRTRKKTPKKLKICSLSSDDSISDEEATDVETDNQEDLPVDDANHHLHDTITKKIQLDTRISKKRLKSVNSKDKPKRLRANSVNELDDEESVSPSNNTPSMKTKNKPKSIIESVPTDEGTESCKVCFKKFTRASELTRHSRCHSSQTYTCQHCSLEFVNPLLFKRHSVCMHGERQAFVCPQPDCTFKSDRLSNVEKHAVIHTDVKMFTCAKCGKSFAQDNGLRSHLLSCTQARSFLCDLCGAKFNHLQSMRSHRRVHTGEKPYRCSDCGSQFADHRNYKRHRRIHENIFPYQCLFCNKHFRHSNSLKAHLSMHNICTDEDKPSPAVFFSAGDMGVPKSTQNIITVPDCDRPKTTEAEREEEMHLRQISSFYI